MVLVKVKTWLVSRSGGTARYTDFSVVNIRRHCTNVTLALFHHYYERSYKCVPITDSSCLKKHTKLLLWRFYTKFSVFFWKWQFAENDKEKIMNWCISCFRSNYWEFSLITKLPYTSLYLYFFNFPTAKVFKIDTTNKCHSGWHFTYTKANRLTFQPVVYRTIYYYRYFQTF